MDTPLLLRGLVVGFGIAAPVGPIGLLCIQRTLSQGRSAGLVSGLGAASADAVYGFIAAFGLTLVTAFLVGHQLWLGIIGGAFLIFLGVKTFRTPPAQQAAEVEQGTLSRAYLSTFVLTLTNPMTILSFVAIFAGAGLATQAAGASGAALMVLGVFIGSATWWLLLSGGVSLLRGRIDGRVMTWVNRGAGVLIIGFGLYALATAL
jgi:threonine/homoserine/homoserine lactone efflux protein